MVRRFDADRQEWAGGEQEGQFGELHRRDALRQYQAVMASVTAIVICGLAFGTYALGWKDEPKPPAALPSPAPQSPGDTRGPSASPAPSGPPAGYEVTQDAEGFRIAVPDGWQRSTAGSTYGFAVVNYRNSDGSRRLQVFEVEDPSPYESLQTFLEQLPKSKGFEKISLKQMPDADGSSAARLEYLTDKVTGEPDVGGGWHILDHRFEAADGKLYALESYGAEADGRADELEVLSTALTWFCPPLTECATPSPTGD